MELTRSLGIRPDGSNLPSEPAEREQLVRYINIKLAALGVAPVGDREQTEYPPVPHGCTMSHGDSLAARMRNNAHPRTGR